MISPIKRKSGTGSNEKELIDLKMLKISWVSPFSPQKMYPNRILMKRKEKATGTPKKNKKINEKKININKVTQSINIPPSPRPPPLSTIRQAPREGMFSGEFMF
jgi:hypothetical protein